MKNAILALLGVASIPALRAAIKSYRAHKAAADIVVDAVEAGIDAIDKP